MHNNSMTPFHYYCQLLFLLNLSCHVTVVVYAKASTAKSSLKVITGDQVELDCVPPEALAAMQVVDRDQLTRLQWTKDGATVASYNQASQSAEWWVANPRFVLDRFSYRLTIYNVQRDDDGNYRCRPQTRSPASANRPPLTDADATELIVIGPPTAPGKAVVTAHTSRTATVSWEASRTHPDAIVIQYIIVVSVGREGYKDFYKEVYSAGNRTTKLIPSLQPYTVYTFYVIAENIAGKSAPGDSSLPIRTKGEAPVSPPKIKYAYNVTNTSVMLTWEHPSQRTLHGPLVGYRIIARPQLHQLPGLLRKEYYVNKPDINSFELMGLAVYTHYAISLEADNTYGYSPPDTTIILTEEGVPAIAPSIIHLVARSSFSIEIAWIAPNKSNGHVAVYTIYYWPESKSGNLEYIAESQVRIPVVPPNRRTARTAIGTTEAGARELMIHVLQDLDSYTKYFIVMTASTSKGEGPRSDKASVITDTSAPVVTRLINISASGLSSVYLEWLPAEGLHGQPDMYNVRIQDDDQQFSTYNATDTFMYLNGLLPDKRYFVSVRGLTNSITNSGRTYVGDYSAVEIFMIEATHVDAHTLINIQTTICPNPNGEHQNPYIRTTFCVESIRDGDRQSYGSGETPKLSTVAIFVAVVLTLIILAIVAALLTWRKCKKHPPYKLKQVNSNGAVYVTTANGKDAPDNAEDQDAIAAEDFPEHVAALHADSDLGFSKEYESIDHMSVPADEYASLTCEQALLPVNKPKNRYVNILPYDHSRVILRAIPSKPGSDYINANYVDGYCQPRAYIATQGPLPHTYGDFWRMVWELRCPVIVMITNVFERGKKKCDQYWPSEGPETYDWFQIKVLTETNNAYYTIRTISIRNLKLKQKAERMVFHYQYKDWPDHGVPEQALPVLTFVRKSSAAAGGRNTTGPIVVHCSAGVGRSGCYIVCDAMLRQMQAKRSLIIRGFLRRIRTQRNYLVQTEDQYIFCYDALLEAVQSGETEIGCTELPQYVDDLELPQRIASDGVGGVTATISTLESQFKLLRTNTPKPCQEATRVCNKNKNRNSELVALDAHRVLISLRPGIEGSDYINAIFLQGYHRLDEFIVTQFPTEQTQPDFWQLIWDYQCRTIILLTDASDENDANHSSFKRFWPTIDSAPLECFAFTVQQTHSESGENWAVHDFALQALQDDYQLCCRMVCSPGWPGACETLEAVFDLMDAAQDWHLQFHDKSPIVVVDRYGGCEAATFCALTTISAQMEQEGTADIYQIAKLYCSRRPNLFLAIESYHFLYQAAKALVLSELRDMTASTHSNGNARPTSATRRLRKDDSRASLCNAVKRVNSAADFSKAANGKVTSPSMQSISTSELTEPSLNAANTMRLSQNAAGSIRTSTTPQNGLPINAPQSGAQTECFHPSENRSFSSPLSYIDDGALIHSDTSQDDSQQSTPMTQSAYENANDKFHSQQLNNLPNGHYRPSPKEAGAPEISKSEQNQQVIQSSVTPSQIGNHIPPPPAPTTTLIDNAARPSYQTIMEECTKLEKHLLSKQSTPVVNTTIATSTTHGKANGYAKLTPRPVTANGSVVKNGTASYL